MALEGESDGIDVESGGAGGRRPCARPAVRCRRDDVVRRPRMARARPARRGRVRASGHRRQAGAARGELSSVRLGRGAARVVRPGDVLVVVATADSRARRRLLRRAEAWGLLSVWIGAGVRPSRGRPTTCSGSTIAAGAARHDGRLVLLYHLLWELTHVCFEHPGLAGAAGRRTATMTCCLTCSDEGRQGEVVADDRRRRVGANRSRLETRRHDAGRDGLRR